MSMNRNDGACCRKPLVDAIATFLARDHALGLGDIRASLARTIDEAGPAAIEVAHERLRLGEALLVFPEGTRGRTGQMQRLLPGAARYTAMQ